MGSVVAEAWGSGPALLLGVEAAARLPRAASFQRTEDGVGRGGRRGAGVRQREGRALKPRKLQGRGLACRGPPLR